MSGTFTELNTKQVSSRLLALAMYFFIGVGCTGSNSDFGNILANSDGGTGYASVAIQSYSPAVATYTVKKEASQTFLVAAVGDGTLTYKWTVDGAEVGSNSPSFTLSAPSYSVGLKTLKVVISDSKGAVSQEWSVKVNGTPVISTYSPSASTSSVRRLSSLNFSVTATDPNNDSLTYVWKLDGSESGITATTSSAIFTPAAVQVGQHVVTVDVYDGTSTDSGTYKVTQSWTVNVNHFNDGCNTMSNNQSTNRTCVYVGVSSLGDGINPDSAPTSGIIRPSGLFATSTGNLFYSDETHDVVYYWNRSAVAETLLGVTVPAHTTKVIAGVGDGAAVSTTASTKALRNPLNNPQGLFYDGSNLYIADLGNALVRVVNSSGDISTVLGGGSSHVDGVAATTHACSNPYSVIKTGTNLFVTCSNNHRVKRVDLSTGFAYTFAGTGTAGNPADMNESSPTDATNGPLNLPYGLALDTSGNLFISEYTGCRVRMVNRTAGLVTLYGTYNISAGSMRIVVGAAGAPTCSYVNGEAVDLTGATDARIDNPRQIWFYNNRLFLATYSNHSIVAVNFTGSSVVYGSTTVASYFSTRIIGTGSGGYQGEGGNADATRLNAPFAVTYDTANGYFYIADYSNFRIRRVNASHKMELIFGDGTVRISSAGNGTVEATSERFNRPRHLAYDTVNEELLIPDISNYRIRKVSKYGESSTVIGLGTAGTGAEENEFPTSVTVNDARSIAFVDKTSTFGGHIAYIDSANHRVRFYNRGTTSATYFGVTVEPGKVVSIAGTGSSGNGTSGSALTAALNAPEGIAYDGSNLYVSDRGNHCIKKIDNTGTLSVAGGTCGTAGNVNGSVNTARMNNPGGMAYYENGTNRGIFIADISNARVRFLRIAGSSPIAGVPVLVGDTNSVACGGGYHDDGIIASNSVCSNVYGVAIVGSKFCFTNFGFHNVRCVEATTGIITTVYGALQGIDNNQPKWFPGTSTSTDGQNNVTAAPGVTEPATTESFGVANSPLGITTGAGNILYISEWGSSLIRKLQL